MFRPRACVITLLWVFTATVPMPGQQLPGAAPTAVDVGRLGPQVGDRVPSFILQDQRGQPRTLSSLMGPKGAVLVFFRSADW
jgi:hypothetical protein